MSGQWQYNDPTDKYILYLNEIRGTIGENLKLATDNSAVYFDMSRTGILEIKSNQLTLDSSGTMSIVGSLIINNENIITTISNGNITQNVYTTPAVTGNVISKNFFIISSLD